MTDSGQSAPPPETRFTVTYEGPELRGGRMDARELGQAILSTSKLIERAGGLSFPGEQQISLEVDAKFREGSFEVVYHIVSWVGQKYAALSAHDLETIYTMIFGTGGAIKLLLFLKGRKPERVDKRGTDVSINIEGERAHVDMRVYNFVTDPQSAEAFKGLVAPLRREGINRVDVSAPFEGRTEIVKEEARYLERLPTPEEEVEHDRYSATLEVVSPHFRSDHKWEFSHGGSSFWARIDDESFLEDVQSHRITFGVGDRIRADVELETRRRGNEVTHERRVVHVEEVIPVRDDQIELGQPTEPRDGGADTA